MASDPIIVFEAESVTVGRFASDLAIYALPAHDSKPFSTSICKVEVSNLHKIETTGWEYESRLLHERLFA